MTKKELKYFRHDIQNGTKEEITYDRALPILTGRWKDCDMLRDMLTIPNRIAGTVSYIEVEEHQDDGNIMVLMAGLQNMLPMEFRYDEDGKRSEVK